MRSGPVIFALGAIAIVVFLFYVYDSSSGAVTRSPSGEAPASLYPVSVALAAPALDVRRELISGSPSRSSRRTQIKAVICEVFGRYCGAALRVASCETGGTFNPRALGSAGERGIFQIHPVHFRWVREGLLWLPRYNARVAHVLSQGGRNWSHWTCQP